MYIEIRTTCRPEVNEELFFKFNPIVLQAIKNNFQIRIFNDLTDLPSTLRKQKKVKIRALKGNYRPSLGLLSEDINTNFVLICNSDVFMSKDSIEKIKNLPMNNYKAISGRRYDIYNKIYYPSQPDEKLLVDIGYKQSNCTLDYFLLDKATLEKAGAVSKLIHLKLGTVQFDVRFASWLNQRKLLIDASQYLTFFHRNHESFRTVFRTSILLDMEENIKFALSRRMHAGHNKSDTGYGSLEFTKKYLNSDGLILRRIIPGRLKIVLSKVVIKVSNFLEKRCHSVNNTIYELFKRDVKIVVISRKFKFSLVIPFGTRIKDIPYKIVIEKSIERDFKRITSLHRNK